RNAVQAFEQAIPVREGAKADAQIGLDLLAAVTGGTPALYNAANIRAQMAAESPALADLAAAVKPATTVTELTADMAMVEL
ncbi:MAG TPA: hypothetical protein VEB22_14960, partial [Phycisphaerales bacterium]|nr:hypothetical protein [Phycisphaerales bacterium]